MTSLELVPDNVVTSKDVDTFFAHDGTSSPLESDHEQKIALELNISGDSDSTIVNSSILLPTDARVHLEPHNKLVLSPSTDILSTAESHCKKRSLSKYDPILISAVAAEIGNGVEEACGVSATSINDQFEEVWREIELTAKEVSDLERHLIDRDKAAADATGEGGKGKRKAKGEETMDEQELNRVKEFLSKFKKTKGLKTISEKLLQFELEKLLGQKKTMQDQIKAQKKLENNDEDDDDDENGDKEINENEDNTFNKVDADGDGKIDRGEWRDWADEQIKIMTFHNEERATIIQENRRLRMALTRTSDGQKEELLRENDAIMSSLSAKLALAQLQNSNLLAELHAVERLKFSH